MHQGAAQAEFLLHAARKLARRTLGKRCQAGGLQQPRNPRLPLGGVQAEQAGVKVDILIDG